MNKLLSIFLVLTFQFLIFNSAQAQKEANIWYFGYGAGLDFNSGSPVALTNGALITDEGCSSICDANGNLLFYTDGITIWNKNHLVMANGTGLTGNASSTQSGLIVKQPGNSNLYYVFTTNATLNYSVVDLNLNGGLGDVTAQKNIFMMNSGEKLCATKHANGVDVWILMHEPNTDGFNAFLLDATGVNPAPSHSNTGIVDGILGQMKISPQGTKVAFGIVAIPETICICDFDRTTGLVSNGFGIITVPNQTYGLEFSQDGSRLYTAGAALSYDVYQYDMNAGSQAAIIASATIVGTTANFIPAGMQLGPDNKVYVTLYGAPSLAVINDPNTIGTGCNFVDNAIPLMGPTCQLGLPGYVSNIFDSQPPVALFNAPHHICPGTCTNFTNMSQNGISYQWTFTGANPSVSTDANPTNICYNTPGNYSVQLIATNANGSDTLTLNNYITVYPSPAPQGISQSGDTLFANQGSVSYQWYHTGVLIPGATDYFYLAQGSGDYNVVCTDGNGCEVEAAIFDVVASVQSAASNEQLEIYPNPVAEELLIKNGKLKIEAISIYNALGECVLVVKQETISRKTEAIINVRSMPSGIYMIEVASSERICRTKLVKK